MAFANPAMELESLFVRIFADASSYFKTIRMVQTQNISVRSSLLSLAGTAASASMNLAKLAASVVGLGVAFGRLDDSLTRALAHMRDWNQVSKPMLERAVFNISSGSRTSAFELARGLDVLVSAGMNAAMATQALNIAETFAVASGMDMETATRRLVDVQRSLGLITQDVTENFRQMTRVSDTFVGMAPLVGSSVREFADAFGPRFVSAMKMVNMSLDEGAVLQGVYSLNQIRGSHASDMAARALQQLTNKSIENIFRWRQLGVEVYTTSGQFRGMEPIVSDLSRQLGNMTPMQQSATLALLGFEYRAIASILPLVNMGEAFRSLDKEIANFGGISRLTAEMLRRDFIGQLKILWNNLTNVATVIGSHLAPIIAYFADQIKTLAKWFIDLHPAVRSFMVISGLTLLAIGPLFKLLTSLIGLLNPLKLFASVWTNFKYVITTLISPLTALGSLLYRIVSFGFNTMLVAATAVMKVVWSISAGLLDAFGTIVGLIANFIVWSFAIAGIVTLLMGLGTFISAIGVGIGALFTGFMALVRELAGALEENWKEIRDGGVDAFMGVRDAAHSFFTSVGDLIIDMAGFFYNFEENFDAILKFLKENWRDLLTDIENGIAVVARNLLTNFGHAWEMIKAVAGPTFMFIMDHLDLLRQKTALWLIINFPIMLDNLKTIFASFFENLLRNWVILVGAMGEVLLNGIRSMARNLPEWLKPFTGLDLVEHLLPRQRTFGEIMTDVRGGMRSPLQDMPELRGLRSMGEILGVNRMLGLSGRAPFPDLNMPAPTFPGASIMQRLNKIFGDLVPLTEGFKSALRNTLLLNLNLPPDALNAMIAGFRKFFRPMADLEESQVGMQATGMGPGFTFKQISLARFMVGGESAERLDYEQLVALRQIASHTENLAQVANRFLSGRAQGDVIHQWGLPNWVPALGE